MDALDQEFCDIMSKHLYAFKYNEVLMALIIEQLDFDCHCPIVDFLCEHEAWSHFVEWLEGCRPAWSSKLDMANTIISNN